MASGGSSKQKETSSYTNRHTSYNQWLQEQRDAAANAKSEKHHWRGPPEPPVDLSDARKLFLEWFLACLLFSMIISAGLYFAIYQLRLVESHLPWYLAKMCPVVVVLGLVYISHRTMKKVKMFL